MIGLYWNRKVLGPPIAWFIALPHVLLIGIASWYVTSQYNAVVLYSDEEVRTVWTAYEAGFFWPNDEGWNSKWNEVAKPLFSYLKKVGVVLLLIAPLNMMFLLEVLPKRWVHEIETSGVRERASKKSGFGLHILAVLWMMFVVGVYILPWNSYRYRWRWMGCSDASFSTCVGKYFLVASLSTICVAILVWFAREIYVKTSSSEETEE